MGAGVCEEALFQVTVPRMVRLGVKSGAWCPSMIDDIVSSPRFFAEVQSRLTRQKGPSRADTNRAASCSPAMAPRRKGPAVLQSLWLLARAPKAPGPVLGEGEGQQAVKVESTDEADAGGECPAAWPGATDPILHAEARFVKKVLLGYRLGNSRPFGI